MSELDQRIIVGGDSLEPNPYTLIPGKTYTCEPYREKGGAIYVHEGGVLKGSKVTFADNKAGEAGGAIYNEGEVTLSEAAVFSGNMTENSSGGAIYNKAGFVNISDGATFIGNYAESRFKYAYVCGGAVYNDCGTIAISGDAIFSGNTARDGGDAVYNDSGTITITGDAVFRENNAVAVCNDGGTIIIGGTATFSENSGVSNSEGTITINGSATFIGNSGVSLSIGTFTIGGNATFSENSGVSNSEGTITINGSATFIGNSGVSLSIGTFTIGGNATFNGNMAGDGGAVRNYCGALAITGDATFESNTGTYGGAIYNVFSPFGIITIGGAVTFCENTAGDAGGAIYNDGEVTIGGEATFSGNTAKDGGAIYNSTNGEVTIGGEATFSGNTAGEGDGGAVCNDRGTITIGGEATFSGNTAGEGDGGAVCNDCGTITILSGAFFTENTAEEGNGGAVYNCIEYAFWANAILSINGNVTFSRNRAVEGGAIYNDDKLSMDDEAIFIGNKAAYGGAVYNDGEIVMGEDAVFSGNTAGYDGSAIYNKGTIFINGNAVFSGNTVEDEDGAAIRNNDTIHIAGTIDLQTEDDTWINTGSYFDYQEYYAIADWDLTEVTDPSQSTVCIKNFQWYRNENDYVRQTITVRADQTVGDYVIATGDFSDVTGKDTFVITGVKGQEESIIVVGKEADTYSGAVYSLDVDDNGTAEDRTDDRLILSVEAFHDRIIVGGTSTEPNPCTLDEGKNYASVPFNGDGGAVYIWKDGVLEGTEVSFVCNSADGAGGAIYNIGTVVANGNTILSKNRANDGGAIYNKGAVTFNGDVLFSENTAAYYGAFFNSGKMVFDGDALFSGNSATSGSAFYNNEYGDISFNRDAVFSGNTTGTSGAVYNYGRLAFNGAAIFSDNVGGGGSSAAIDNGGTITINGDALFSGNSANDSGAIKNNGTIYVNGDATLSGNTAVQGGAIDNYGKIFINGNAIFSDNTAEDGGGAIQNYGTITINGAVLFRGNTAETGGGAIFNVFYGKINIAGTVDLQTENDTWVNTGYSFSYGDYYATVNWELSGVADASESTVCIKNFQWYINENNYVRQTITVNARQAAGDYVIATGDFSDVGNKDTFILTGIEGQEDVSITIGGEAVMYKGTLYSLAVVDNGLHLVVDRFVPAPQSLCGDADGLSWEGESPRFVVQYSKDEFATVLSLETTGCGVDAYAMPEGSYQWRVKNADNKTPWVNGNEITVPERDNKSMAWVSESNNIQDIFFANAESVWEKHFIAQHIGSPDGWKDGTGETVELTGKNRISDTFAGSGDASILVLTDDANGDALFVDDIFSAFPDEQQSRLAELDEIRAGAGDDLVDMTSQRFAYKGAGLTIRGGLGDDTVWASKGDNLLFGDAGSDRLVGASGDDVLAGGIGDDSLHGGGGNDVFCFCQNWGQDTVEQLADGKVTLWFGEGDISQWDPNALTYKDGLNTVKVSGISSENISLKFGDDGSEQYENLLAAGAFEGYTSECIFEDSRKGMIA